MQRIISQLIVLLFAVSGVQFAQGASDRAYAVANSNAHFLRAAPSIQRQLRLENSRSVFSHGNKPTQRSLQAIQAMAMVMAEAAEMAA